jgi:hypothetical protein
MNYPRKNFAALVVGGGNKILVIGGDGTNVTEGYKNIEIYDPKTGVWSMNHKV